MLINLSNHPSDRWGDEQRQQAIEQYGGIEDVAFPQISPQATHKEVKRLAESYAVRIQNRKNETTKIAVHLMGEMTFTYILVNQLLAAGIPCLASTTHRTVEEKDGKKIVQFQFVQFREY